LRKLRFANNILRNAVSLKHFGDCLPPPRTPRPNDYFLDQTQWVDWTDKFGCACSEQALSQAA